jgi:hypothetical protein
MLTSSRNGSFPRMSSRTITIKDRFRAQFIKRWLLRRRIVMANGNLFNSPMSIAKLLRTLLLGLSSTTFTKTLKRRLNSLAKLVGAAEGLKKTHRAVLERLDELERSPKEALEQLRLRPSPPPEFVPPGHYYSPLLDIESLVASSSTMLFDGVECWEHIDLQAQEQRIYYQDLLDRFPSLPFPSQKTQGYRYFANNDFFNSFDAFTLSGIIRKENPRRIVEIGSGFSSAVMLDTFSQTQTTAELTIVEPFPDRLHSLLSSDDSRPVTILVQPVEEVSLSVFDQLEAGDILFIDSSHVAKIGSDVTIILLRILPRLRRGCPCPLPRHFLSTLIPSRVDSRRSCLERVHISEGISSPKPGVQNYRFQFICRRYFPRALPGSNSQLQRWQSLVEERGLAYGSLT